jgi:hypothetical protein
MKSKSYAERADTTGTPQQYAVRPLSELRIGGKKPVMLFKVDSSSNRKRHNFAFKCEKNGLYIAHVQTLGTWTVWEVCGGPVGMEAVSCMAEVLTVTTIISNRVGWSGQGAAPADDADKAKRNKRRVRAGTVDSETGSPRAIRNVATAKQTTRLPASAGVPIPAHNATCVAMDVTDCKAGYRLI